MSSVSTVRWMSTFNNQEPNEQVGSARNCLVVHFCQDLQERLHFQLCLGRQVLHRRQGRLGCLDRHPCQDRQVGQLIQVGQVCQQVPLDQVDLVLVQWFCLGLQVHLYLLDFLVRRLGRVVLVVPDLQVCHQSPGGHRHLVVHRLLLVRWDQHRLVELRMGIAQQLFPLSQVLVELARRDRLARRGNR